MIRQISSSAPLPQERGIMATQSAAAQLRKPRAVYFPILDKYFYFGMSLLIAATVVYGFSHTVDQNLIHAAPARPWILWTHGIVMSAWLAFFIFQSALVRTHNVKVHRLTGWFGAGLAASITVLGIATAVIMDRFLVFRLHVPNEQWFFSIQLWDMVAFTTCFWLAVYWRKKPEFHRRLVLLATCALTAAAFGRMPWLSRQWFYAGVDALILLGVARDLLVNRRVHVVYRYALPAFVVAQVFAVNIWMRHPEWWERLTSLILR